MNKEKTLDIVKKIKKGNIDVRKTIENTIKSEYVQFKHGYVSPVKDKVVFPKDMVEIMDTDKSYKDALDEEFYEKVNECLNNEGVYISLAYASDMETTMTKEDCETITFDYDDGDEMLTTYIFAGQLQKKFVVSLYSEICGCIEEDHGIIVKNTENGQEVIIGTRSFGPTCYHPPSLVEFSQDGDDFDLTSLNNPITQIMVEMMDEIIVYEE